MNVWGPECSQDVLGSMIWAVFKRRFALGSNDIEVWEEMEGEERGGHSEMKVL